ncbi:MAG: beta-N-acetylhexosaminidase [Waddliaceae bacterium]|nr:beta-N-acetylhexosaminidase [Waddliaceae bacterium]MBT3579642.1 beta-N-acetylhexosaminidase [Waddliaceae bacterium]MBT4445227.1 beta-N-acetylhexosaminidase [Waddliaceae bacterium]MBT6928113.1 beta-N-acetylhexosaminidase [Waddliaceae bacterium]MBT7264674.1 beta-N-acetylhexosaminidase [Waddliaceae bacterium]
MKSFIFLLSAIMFVLASNNLFCSYDSTALPLNEKVGQMLIMHFNGEEINDDARRLIDEVHLGGIIYFTWANVLENKEKVRLLSEDLRRYAKEQGLPPLVICADQEGGRVARLRGEFRRFPSNKEVGDTGDLEYGEEVAYSLAKEMHSVGFTMNFAPVVDVNNNPLNPVINDRAFGDDPDIVTAFGERSIAGHHKAGMAVTLKHFPGHGDVSVDSHRAIPIVVKPKEELDAMELFPFKSLINDTDAIMSAHILMPALDKDNCATLSRKILRGLLREEMGFEGVVVSDSLVMQSVIDECDGDIAEVSIQAIAAGCDMLCLGGRVSIQGEDRANELTVDDVIAIQSKIIAAVEEGRISENEIDASLKRIQALKERY